MERAPQHRPMIPNASFLYLYLTGVVCIHVCLVCWPFFFLYRLAVILAAKCFLPLKLHGILDIVAHVFAGPDYANNPTTCSMVCVLELQGEMTKDQLTTLVEDNVINAKRRWIFFKKLKYPQLKCFPYKFLGYLFWKSESNFSTKAHIKVCSLNRDQSESTTLIMSSLHQIALNTSLPSNQSPWDITLFRNNHKNTTFVAVRIHHCLGDGRSLLKLIVHHLGGKSVSTAKLPRPLTRAGNTISWLWWPVTLQFLLVKTFAESKFIHGHSPKHPFRVFNHQLGTSKLMVTMSRQFCLNKIKSASEKQKGVCTTAFLLAAISGGVKKYIEKRKKDRKFNKDGLIIPFAIAKQNHPDVLTNGAIPGELRLPTDVESIEDRLHLCNERYLYAKNNVYAKCASIYMHLSLSYPQCVKDKFLMFDHQVTAFTNLAGEEEAFSVGGLQVLDSTFSSGQPRSSIGVTFSVLSYRGKFRFCTASRDSTLSKKNCRILMDCLEGEMDLLIKKSL